MRRGGLSLSLTGPAGSPILEEAIAFAVQRGALFVAASGNLMRCDDCVMYPARLPAVVAVGCRSLDEMRCVSGSAADAPSRASDQAYAAFPGTSMATARGSGAGAVAWSAARQLRAADVRALLRVTADDVGTPGGDLHRGDGILDVRAALLSAPDG